MKNRSLKDFLGKSLDFSFLVICWPERFDVTKHVCIKASCALKSC